MMARNSLGTGIATINGNGVKMTLEPSGALSNGRATNGIKGEIIMRGNWIAYFFALALCFGAVTGCSEDESNESKRAGADSQSASSGQTCGRPSGKE